MLAEPEALSTAAGETSGAQPLFSQPMLKLTTLAALLLALPACESSARMALYSVEEPPT